MDDYNPSCERCGEFMFASEEPTCDCIYYEMEDLRRELSRLRRIAQPTNDDLPQKEELLARLTDATNTINQYKQDAIDAAGELMIDIPEPGSKLAKALMANTLIRNERDKYWELVCDLRHKHSELLEKLEQIANGDV